MDLLNLESAFVKNSSIIEEFDAVKSRGTALIQRRFCIHVFEEPDLCGAQMIRPCEVLFLRHRGGEREVLGTVLSKIGKLNSSLR